MWLFGRWGYNGWVIAINVNPNAKTTGSPPCLVGIIITAAALLRIGRVEEVRDVPEGDEEVAGTICSKPNSEHLPGNFEHLDIARDCGTGQISAESAQRTCWGDDPLPL